VAPGGPLRKDASLGGNPNLAARAGERVDVDLIPAGLVRLKSLPLAVGRKTSVGFEKTGARPMVTGAASTNRVSLQAVVQVRLDRQTSDSVARFEKEILKYPQVRLFP